MSKSTKYVLVVSNREYWQWQIQKHNNHRTSKLLEDFYAQPTSNPANDKYAWIGGDKAEIIVLQDFRWSSKLITWKDLLLPLEGETVKLPAPKNKFADVCIKTDVPIFSCYL